MHNTNMQLSPRTDTAPLTLWPRNHFFVLLKTKATVAFTKHVLSNEASLSPTAGRDHKKKPSKITDLVLKYPGNPESYC